MKKFICIHGHFYQPPREDPWTGAVPLQSSAAPHHDWNERITAECYEPFAAARLLDAHGHVAGRRNLYPDISFDIGPTLLAWLEHARPAVVRALREGRRSAIAMPYHHVIMPLARRRDKVLQVEWGIADFRRRFDRAPHGMWLPETAVDLETLDIMAAHGIRFTILAPHQAAAEIDSRVPYRVRLPSGRSIAVFFYNGPIAHAVSFERLLTRSEDLVQRLLAAFADSAAHPQLVSIATDGEVYGHHHTFGEMALAHAQQLLAERKDVQLTTYENFLERYPPEHEVKIHEHTSWSCAHGLLRWRGDCPCGSRPGWNTAWRAPLRVALEWLQNEIDATVGDVPMELVTLTQAMMTSCGWFFEDLARIETMQILKYAARAVELTRELSGRSLAAEFLERLAVAKSNQSGVGSGREIYQRIVNAKGLTIELLP